MRHNFTSRVAFLFRELVDFTKDVETDWDLLKSAAITSAAASCGCKRVGGQTGNEKRTAWWNHEILFSLLGGTLLEDIYAKKTVFRID